MKFKFLPHTADIKFQAFGESLGECFENASYALVNIICKEKIKPKIKKTIKVSGKDKESLLYNFLEEFLYLLDSDNFIMSKIEKIKINNKFELIAEITGDSSKNYETEGSVKAVTYNDMWIKKDGDKFKCQVVVDV